ncbi:hypothetical protein [Vitreoscilla stercoraria]|uniref:Uncharacterized protein n=1 Tax=Vitreoscilla stercoraria TaxID=61 RepID=A0ABY4EFB8_VITST|nr:hypothetical protein [Vitreoscilla stercoraria]UOO93408.1 hypothetical protein LVJ81_05100 [Vitreoscilla stercoraria]
MIPNNQLSSTPIPNEFLTPTRMYPLVDYEWGGVGIRDLSQGRNGYLWSSSYVDNKIILSNPLGSHEILTVANVVQLSFAFDLNMNPYIAYKLLNGQSYLYWYDSTVNAAVTTPYGTVLSPMLALDDIRPNQNANADVIFAYVRDGMVYVRNQRERFQTEHQLGVFDAIVQMGMMRNYRLGFINVKVKKYY